MSTLEQRMADLDAVKAHTSQCYDLCRHYSGDIVTEDQEVVPVCPAYPRGIPLGILSGKVRHDRVLPGQDGGTIFEPK